MRLAPIGFSEGLAAAVAALERESAVERLWQRDHTLWSPDPHEISNRLGWLDAAPSDQELAAIAALVDEVRHDGYDHAVLLGMGGSSLGAEALARSFGDREGYPRLLVLDSTVPDWVRQVRAAAEPLRTLYLVASKSGTTAEVNALFDYFWGEVTRLGSDDPGRHFAAITDPGTTLGELATARGFRAVFENPPDIGGRFSVLSLFGAVPAALAGIDLGALLRSAGAARAACRPERSLVDNPGAALGAFLGAGAAAGRWLLTLLVPQRLASFGLWAEQLVAESTGKHGKGILPIAGEPASAVESYGADRLFAHLRLDSEPDREVEAHAARLRASGQPVWDLPLADVADLGGQMFVWQVATALAGHLLGIHPFDQPDVQAAKSRTHDALAAWEEHGALPAVDAPDDLAAEIAQQRPAYVALLGYLAPSAELETAIAAVRRALLDRHGIATTFGYGPRYLHSTGQLHKGGPPGGLHVQLVPGATADLAIPGRRYGFATLAAAQADGDLQALAGAGKRAARLVLDDAAGQLTRLAGSLQGG
jgi:glucose-6-phosphate isomerase